MVTVDASLELRLLGDFRLSYGGSPVTTIDTPRMQSLLAYLALQRGTQLSRQHIAFSFWPDSTSKQAFANLRTLLHHLRRALPDADRFLDVEPTTLAWNAHAPCSADVWAFEEALSAAQEALQYADEETAVSSLEEAMRLYQGQLLVGLYDEWIFPERERLHQACVRGIEQLAHLFENRRDYTSALSTAQRLLGLDALREPSYRLLMRLHALKGDRAAVVRIYQSCSDLLRRELQLEPEPSTRMLLDELVQGTDRPRHDDGPASDEPESGSAQRAPLVGRYREWKQLQETWSAASEGRALLTMICGVAGIGKTRLADELLDWAARQGAGTARARAYAAEGRLAYAPATDWLRSPTLSPGLSELDSVWLAEISRLLPELRAENPELPEPSALAETWQRQRLFEALARAIVAGNQKRVLFLDDLQWCDQDTLEWLRFIMRFAPHARLLIVATVRSDEVDADHPLHALRMELERTNQVLTLELDALSPSETTELAAQVAGRDLTADQAARLYADTEGHPLFIVETVRAGSPSTIPTEERDGHGHAPLEAMPPTVQSVISQRLAQLSPAARTTAGMAAVVGRPFTLDTLLRAGYVDEGQLAEAFDELWQRRILHEEAPNVYNFTHDRLREVAYAQLNPARRRLLHRRVAQALQEDHGADPDAAGATIAAHCEQGGLDEEAISFYMKAAAVAQRVYADEEIVRLLGRALALLRRQPEDRARDERELDILRMLCPAVITTRGWAHPDVGEAFERAHTLAQNLNADEQLFPSLWGLTAFHLVRAELDDHRRLAGRLLHMAEERPSTTLTVISRLGGFFNAFFQGALVEACAHLDVAFDIPGFEEQPVNVLFIRTDERVFCHCCAAHGWWFLGYPDRAIGHSARAIALADETGHPFDQVCARSYTSMLHQYRREPRAAEEHARAAAALCERYGFYYYGAWCTIMEGWAQMRHGAAEEAIAQMTRGLIALRDTGAVLREPYYLGLIIQAHIMAERIDEATPLLNVAMDAAHRRSEHWIEPELHRLLGELRLAEGARDAAAQHFSDAVDLATRQKARPLALRAATALARLWHAQGKRLEAKELLYSHYSVFSEGHDTPDLTDAAALLDAWS